MQTFLTSITLTLPMVLSATLHMVIVKCRLFRVLDRPIHLKSFGANKTVRGLVVMPILTVFSMVLCRNFAVFQGSSWALLGFLLGLTYVLFELPNSFIKRRLGIPPGSVPPKNRLLFIVVDRTDSLLGCALVYALFLKGHTEAIALMFLIGPIIHTAMALLLYLAGIRKEAL